MDSRPFAAPELLDPFQVLETALDAVIGVDQDDRVLAWNARAEEIFGWSRAEALGRRMRELIIPPAMRAHHERGMERFLRTGVGPILNRRIEVAAVRRDGTEFPVELTVSPIRTPDGYRFYSFLRDLTEIERARSERRASETQLRIITDALDNSLNGFDIVDANGKFIYVNRAYLQMWGYDSAAEVLGTSPASHCADPETPARIIRELRANGECNLEFVARRRDGTFFDVHMWVRLAHDADGNEIYPSSSIDVTEQNRAAAAAAATLAELDAAIRARDEFLSIASHELRTPLTPLKLQVQSFARELRRSGTAGDERLSKLADTTERAIGRISALIDNLLDVSRINTGRLTLTPETLDLAELARDLVARYAPEISAAGSTVSLAADSPVVGAFDRLRIEQVFANLLTNALKYGERRPIEIAISADEDRAIAVFRDRGIGIPDGERSRIFERFARLDAARGISGMGLGLYITRQIVEAHGGAIEVASEPGRGSVFTVSLPRRGAAD